MGDMDKKTYNEMVINRLNKEIQNRNINQSDLSALCEKKGYSLPQSTISKLLSSSTVNINLLQVAQICDTLEINMGDLFSLDPAAIIERKKKEVQKPEAGDQSDHFITDARNSFFRAYKGAYHGYFYTTENKEFIHRAIFSIEEDPDTQQCIANMSFKTGERNSLNEEIVKRYTGPVIYSNTMQAIYCTLRSDEIGEISYVLLQYDYIAFQNLESRLATVLTVSSGMKRLPTMHRMLLTRKELTDDELAILCGQLRLNNSEIVISENSFREFLSDKVPESFFKLYDEDGSKFSSTVAKDSYYIFNESKIGDSYLPAEDKAVIISLLRKHSIAPRCNKVSHKADELIYKYIKIRMEEEKKEKEEKE